MLPSTLSHADIVVSATGAAGVVVSTRTVQRAMAERDGRPLVLVDLAVPRDVEPGTGDLPDVTLVDIMSLRERLADHDEATAQEIGRAHAIVAEEVHRYVVRRRSDSLAPLIRAIRARGEEILSAELERHAPRLASLDKDERDAVDALTRGIVAKLLHDPIVELKERSEPGTDGVHARLLAELLGIDPNAPEQ
jgi:glutamyl-tRNA reductase